VQNASVLFLFTFIFLFGCSKQKSLEPYIQGELYGMLALHPKKVFDQINRSELLSYPLLRDLMEGSSFKDLWTNIIDDPLSSGLSLLNPCYIIYTRLEETKNHYLVAELDRSKKWETIVSKSGLSNIREYGKFKVIVAEPFAIAWDQNQLILSKSKMMPDLLDAILNNFGTNNFTVEQFWKNYDSRALISGVMIPSVLNLWQENKDRLKHCSLDIDEIDKQFLSMNIYAKQKRLSIDIQFHYCDSWSTFWNAFFNQHQSKQVSTIDSLIPGSIFTSRLNNSGIETIIQGECPVNLIEKYWTVPSKNIIQKIANCLDEPYGIYLPEQERYIDNHLVFFKLIYPEHIQHVLEEELHLQLGENEIRTHIESIKETEKVIYYAVRDSLLILSKNALNILKAEEEIKRIQQLIVLDPVLRQGGFFILPSHLYQLFEINKEETTFFSNIKGNITKNRLRFQINASTTEDNGFESILKFFNYLYIHNSEFYELWEPSNPEIDL
jgi:hypothetical protein